MPELPDSVVNAIQLVTFVLGAYALALYVGLVVWTARDIASRSRDWLVRILAVLMVTVFNLPGLVLYYILRPRETLAEVYGRSLEEEALLQNIEDQTSCPNCRRRVAQDYMVCPNCRTSLKSRCSSCDRLLSPNWEVCPYCGKEQARTTTIRPAPAPISTTPPDEATTGAP
jgi:RNA polymerase subunit RPABC4/transcription elongation factor Spt4